LVDAAQPVAGPTLLLPRVVVLTGGVGSGKSSVAEVLASLGVPIIDTDAIAHQLTGPGGTAIGPLRDALGADYIDARGALDRAKVRALVFADADARRRLEAALHPLIRRDALQALDTLPVGTPYAVLVIPLYFEGSSFQQLAWRVVVVDCPVELQIERVSRRPGLDRASAAAIVAAQVPRETRLLGADFVISNTGDLAALETQAIALHRKLLAAGSAGGAG
jgi:dephospho-CoA kinase